MIDHVNIARSAGTSPADRGEDNLDFAGITQLYLVAGKLNLEAQNKIGRVPTTNPH